MTREKQKRPRKGMALGFVEVIATNDLRCGNVWAAAREYARGHTHRVWRSFRSMLDTLRFSKTMHGHRKGRELRERAFHRASKLPPELRAIAYRLLDEERRWP